MFIKDHEFVPTTNLSCAFSSIGDPTHPYCEKCGNCIEPNCASYVEHPETVTAPKELKKLDQDKIQMELIPVSLLTGIATVLTFGARKYAPRAWEKGFEWSRAYGALLRHLFAWWKGENLDPETGKSHLWHAGCELAFLIEWETTHKELDDRPVQKGEQHEGN